MRRRRGAAPGRGGAGARSLHAGRRARRGRGLRIAAVVALLVAAAAAAVLASAGVPAGDGSRAAAPAARTVERLPPPLPPAQDAVGPLPEPAGAAHVDLAQASQLYYLRLHPKPKAGLAFDLADGRVIWRERATRELPIASLTKLMTALLAVERLGRRQRVRVPRAADQVGGSRMAGLKPGRRVRADVLLKGLLIASANNAAVTLAVAGAGSERAWVGLMNRRAALLGLQCTHFVDSHGLSPRNRSCPADLAVLAMRAIADPQVAAIARKRYARVWPGSGPKLTLWTTNHLLRDRFPGAIGLKTGFTNAAGFCLVTVIQRGARRIGIVVLGSKDAFRDARRIAREAARMGVLPRAT